VIYLNLEIYDLIFGEKIYENVFAKQKEQRGQKKHYHQTLLSIFKYSLASSMYFQLGNSFTPMNFDLSAAYFCTSDLNQITAGIFGFLITFLGYIIYYQNISSTQHFAENSEQQNKLEIDITSHYFIRISSLLLYFIIAVCFRDHLSVWTVFSPKVFIEILDSLFFVIWS
jgi:hypothetical protein